MYGISSNYYSIIGKCERREMLKEYEETLLKQDYLKMNYNIEKISSKKRKNVILQLY